MKTLIFTFLIAFAPSVYAIDETNIRPHTHGVVEMTLVAENNIVEVNLISPLMNLVGFEHHAKTEGEKAALKEMSDVFNKPNDWLRFDNTDCQLKQFSVNYGEENHHDHGHDRHHEVNETGHAELEANYQFTCDHSDLELVEIRLNEHFTGIETIQLSWLISNQSGIATLAHNENQISLKP